ncbi:MAG: glycosyltransferase family 2 protein [Deltaproteobacteria bacterium]|jgi:glycosyltransferase involved in cell wall biosynthesis|nr:glycosyltransferase family 2 protein [Deltaproteobacteria bacterium]
MNASLTDARPEHAPPEITLVVPVYNEEDNVAALAGEIAVVMAAVPRSWELLFVDDGSSDASLAAIRSLAAASSHIRYIALAVNSGQSAAFAAGFREAQGEILVTLDADLQNDPADIPAMLDCYGKNGVNMVVGWRARRRDSLAKRLASKVGNAVRNWIARESIKDTGCSLKVMRKDMACAIPVFNGMHRFFPALMRLEGAVLAEVRVNHRPRRAGVSKYGIWDRARKTAFDLFAVRWLQSRHIAYTIKERNV